MRSSVPRLKANLPYFSEAFNNAGLDIVKNDDYRKDLDLKSIMSNPDPVA